MDDDIENESLLTRPSLNNFEIGFFLCWFEVEEE
jgi:hypothetical protein